MTKHKALTPKRHPGVDSRLRYIDCSCGWSGRLTTPDHARLEFETHASGEVMQWEIDAAHFDAIVEDRIRNIDTDKDQ